MCSRMAIRQFEPCVVRIAAPKGREDAASAELPFPVRQYAKSFRSEGARNRREFLGCRVHSKLSAAGNRHSVRSRLPAPGAAARRPSGKHSGAIGQCEISQVGMHALSKHSSGQIACSLGRTNSMFATPSRISGLAASPTFSIIGEKMDSQERGDCE